MGWIKDLIDWRVATDPFDEDRVQCEVCHSFNTTVNDSFFLCYNCGLEIHFD